MNARSRAGVIAITGAIGRVLRSLASMVNDWCSGDSTQSEVLDDDEGS